MVRLFNRIRRQAETGLSIAAAPMSLTDDPRSQRGHWETDDSLFIAWPVFSNGVKATAGLRHV